MNSVTWLLVFLEDLILASTAVFCPVAPFPNRLFLAPLHSRRFTFAALGDVCVFTASSFFLQFKCVFYSFDSVSSISINCYNYTQ